MVQEKSSCRREKLDVILEKSNIPRSRAILVVNLASTVPSANISDARLMKKNRHCQNQPRDSASFVPLVGHTNAGLQHRPQETGQRTLPAPPSPTSRSSFASAIPPQPALRMKELDPHYRRGDRRHFVPPREEQVRHILGQLCHFLFPSAMSKFTRISTASCRRPTRKCQAAACMA